MLWKKTGVKGESDAISVFKWWPGEFLLNHDMAEPLRSIPCQERGCKGLQRKQGGWKERNWRREAELPFRGWLRDRGAGVDAGRRAGLPLTPPAKPWPSVPRCWPAETAWAGQQHLLSQSDYAGRIPGAGTVCDLLGWSTTPARGAESQGETRQSYRPGPWRQPSSRRAG